MKKLAIIGASYLQEPLIRKAKEMGLETHVFAWAAGDVGEKIADYFHPISIVEKDAILDVCQKEAVSGICSIASDLAAITVNYVANQMGLIGNSMECTYKSTNKHAMRKTFSANDDPSPRSFLVKDCSDLTGKDYRFPVIVKPLDRSGSRGITKLDTPDGLEEAIRWAKEQGFEESALVEEFATGKEYSVECISWQGQHNFLAMTQKYTTGAPNFIETGHLQPAHINAVVLVRVKGVVFHALDSLGIEYGASHSELKIAEDGTITLIEIGGRMGGDFIGSDLVELSTGIDFVRAVIQIAMGEPPGLECGSVQAAAVRFVFTEEDVSVLRRLEKEHPEFLVRQKLFPISTGKIADSSMRCGYYLFHAQSVDYLYPYMPIDAET